MKRVAVVYGGWSSERDVSLSSGRQMAAAAREAGYDVIEVDATRDRGVYEAKSHHYRAE